MLSFKLLPRTSASQRLLPFTTGSFLEVQFLRFADSSAVIDDGPLRARSRPTVGPVESKSGSGHCLQIRQGEHVSESALFLVTYVLPSSPWHCRESMA